MEQPNQHQFFYKRLIIECDQWISRHVVCFANQMHHTEQEKQIFIDGVGKKIEEKVMPGQLESALTVAVTIYTIVEQQAWIEYWKCQLSSPARLFSDIEAITRQTENHLNLQPKLKVKYIYETGAKSLEEVSMLPAEIVCVQSFNKGRKRIILQRRKYTDRPVEYKVYILDTQSLPNGNSQNYANLRDYLDPLKLHLVATTNAIFNEAFYDFDGTDMIMKPRFKFKIKVKDFDGGKFRKIPLNKLPADKKKVHLEMNVCRENYRNHLFSLQNLSSFYTFHKAMQDGK